METLEALTARMDTTQEVQSIVRTMKSLSAVSIRQYDNAVHALRDYNRAVERGLQAVLRQGVHLAQTREDPGARLAAVVFGSERGLCGRFNENLARLVASEIGRSGEQRPFVLSVGGQAASRLSAAGFPPDETLVLPGSVEGLVKTAQSTLIRLERQREESGVGRVQVFFNRRTRRALATPTARILAPTPTAYLAHLAERPWPARGLPIYSMDRDELFSWLLRQHLYVSVYRAGAESLASEHAARLAAMQAAERNISERLDDLSALYRKKRQESITAELFDIVAGFEAQRDESDEPSR